MTDNIYPAGGRISCEKICYPEDEVNQETEVGFLKQTSVRETAPLHTHCFYEIFLVTQGMALHIVNDSVQTIKAGHLVFIRPSDKHCYDFYQTFDFEFMNLGFPIRTFDAVCEYLDNKAKTDVLTTSPLPPVCCLSPLKTQIVSKEFLRIKESIENMPPDFTRLHFRSFLSQIMVQYFMGYETDQPDEARIPLWIENLKKEMSKLESLKQGFSRMIQLANCSKEHLCREFKKYTSLTPTEYINRERLYYSMYLLNHTDMEIVEVADACGFNNLSHFYHLFKKQFGMTPSAVRKIRIFDIKESPPL